MADVDYIEIIKLVEQVPTLTLVVSETINDPSAQVPSLKSMLA